MASMSSCGKRGAACFWLRWAGSRERESPRPRPRGAGSKLGALTCGRVEAVADGESIIMRNTRAIRMVARAQAEGRRVLDVCVLTFLIRGINERRVSDTRMPTSSRSSPDRPLRAHPRSVVIRNVIGLLTTRCVRGSASSPARPAGRRRQWRSGRACGSGVRSHVTRTRRHIPY